ncbi:MAG: hypothetical protein AAFV01_01355 [Bacteroidota bacterium]
MIRITSKPVCRLHSFAWGLAVLAASFLLSVPVTAQEVRVLTQADGDAYVYHTLDIPARGGVRVYRDGALLTPEPLRPAEDGVTFAGRVGTVYSEVASLAERDDPQAVFLRVRTQPDFGAIMRAGFPEVAEALAELYVDADAPQGRATYRVEVVDEDDQPTGVEASATVSLTPSVPEAPTRLRAEHEGRDVTLTWTYPATGSPGAFRFDVYAQREGSAQALRMTPRSILRTSDASTYVRSFAVPALGETYALTVVVRDVTGQQVGSDPFRLEVVDNVPPPRIADVQVRGSSGREGAAAEITWRVSLAPDLVGYHVYRAPRITGPYRRLTAEPLAPLQTAYLDTTAVGGEALHYAVTALDAAGNEGDRSNAATFYMEDRVPPAAPTALSAIADNDQTVALAWEDRPPAPDLATYMILRQRVNDDGAGARGQAWEQLNQTAFFGRRFTDDGAAAGGFAEGAFYRYAVAAVDSAGNVSDSTFTTVQIPDLTPPEPPSYIAATSDEGLRVALAWPASVSKDVTAYLVRRRDPGATRDSIVARVPKGDRYLRDEAVSPGQTYQYTVAAIDSLGNEGFPSPADTLLLRDPSPPRTARNLQAQAEAGSVALAWEPVPAADLMGYRVERATTPSGVYAPAHQGLVPESMWTDPAGAVGQWYRVVAVDTSGNESRPSTAVQARPATAGRP